MGEKPDSFLFMRETIKEKPINKKRLAINGLVAVGLGLMFGVVAATTFAITEHGIDSLIYKQKIEEVKIAEPVVQATGTGEADEVTSVVEPAEISVENMSLASYTAVYSKLKGIASEAGKCLLPISAVASDTDWFSNTYESSSHGVGVVIADNKRELLVLVDRKLIIGAEEIRAALPDGNTVKAVEKKYDSNTGLSVVAIQLEDIGEDALKRIKKAVFSASTISTLNGKNVIAVGAPMGVSGSVGYGIISASTQHIQLVDSEVHILATDIYGSSNATGILVDFNGEVVGIITHDFAEEGSENLITAYSIPDIKASIEHMANGQDKAYLGIYGTDVTAAAMKELSIPEGVYITDIEVESPAMECGIQSGDVITSVGTNEIKNLSQFKEVMMNAQPSAETIVTVQRYTRGGYKELSFEVKLGVLK